MKYNPKISEAGARLDGVPARSLASVVDGGTAHRDIALSMIRLRPGLPTWAAVTDGQARCTFDLQTGDVVEFFDLAIDPEDRLNRADDVDAHRL